MKFFRKIIFDLLAISVFISAQLTKQLIQKEMLLGQSIPVIKDVFHLTHIKNTGAAFGILSGQYYLLLGVGILVMIAIIGLRKRVAKDSLILNAGMGLIFGGSFSNVLDRLVHGGVIDYLDFRVWPVFNLADVAINVGVLLLLIGFFRGKR